MPDPAELIDLTIVAPAHNERECVRGLVEEVGRVFQARAERFELIIVDDGSTDDTRAIIRSLMADRSWLRCIAMTATPPGKGNGQSAAFFAGLHASRGRLIATIDADLQNDPADLPEMLALIAAGADLVQGDRSHARKDNFVRRASSRVGRAFRSMILADTVRDTGCSLRVMKRAFALRLPLEFRGVHRFMPALIAQMGGVIREMPVRHRPRAAGVTKYGFGITQRAIPGLIDCFAVRWMATRRRPVTSVEIAADGAAAQGVPATARVASVPASREVHA